ncbi:molybdopterin-guanine dinucleotide biosynthesis protein B [Halomonas llamarensis]|uniref:Molybdopterin-guanine dinucleotide biosynthesis protein B n=1 Tax=Halomonas llamarensis TaxID=2945104 RepID=A0ABT0SNX6_9GAMM|nr:molybdopterin-guanine dinucleotide biosynthesis protein B [Halomonas llamarensis]MCL7929104.1 molybdopterin-guanine dinucleotide biosynthesis protein B [Halomonas llamarensis]
MPSTPSFSAHTAPVTSMPFPVLSIAAWSGTGKTTLLTQLMPILRNFGLHVGVVKHAHHSFDVDKPGKDSYELRQAGASPMLVASHQRFALMQETPEQQEPDLNHLLSLMLPHAPDLVIVEGFKAWPLAKLVLYREEVGDPAILDNAWVRAAALKAEDKRTLRSDVARLDIDDIHAVADWVRQWALTPCEVNA